MALKPPRPRLLSPTAKSAIVGCFIGLVAVAALVGLVLGLTGVQP